MLSLSRTILTVMEKRNLVLENESLTSLEQEVQQLGPWYHKLPIDQAGEKFTTDFNAATSIKKIENPFDFKEVINKAYPVGLKGKTLLDIGCNGGGHSILACKMEADYVLGLEPRKHWVNQATFLRDKVFNVSSSQFELREQSIQTLENSNKKFDVVLFKDLFNFLLDPIHALKMISDVTNELLIIQFIVSADTPEDCLKHRDNNVSAPMLGVEDLSWAAGGVKVVKHIMEWAGFTDFHIHNVETDKTKITAFDSTAIKQVCMFAAKNNQILGNLDRVNGTI